ncbi:MAG: hypothetical protein ABS95_00750 [Verrucomicrobia bacterium SCN 57-15]|nr:MAG: hypothetical protein ABS95_00750 [Verrucomicrobia bacterium SCN 57-15]
MKSPLHRPPRSVRAAQSKPSLSIAIAYADSLTRRIAKGVCYRIIRRIHHAFDVRAFFWSFEALGQSDTLEQAATVAAGADMILYSVHGADELPAVASIWADRWLARTGQPNGALVALLKTAGPTDGAPLAAEIQLSALARAARMDFFVKIFDRPVHAASSFVVPRAAKQTLRTRLATADDQCGVVMKPTCAFA